MLSSLVAHEANHLVAVDRQNIECEAPIHCVDLNVGRLAIDDQLTALVRSKARRRGGRDDVVIFDSDKLERRSFAIVRKMFACDVDRRTRRCAINSGQLF